jgi:hypothetical protein
MARVLIVQGHARSRADTAATPVLFLPGSPPDAAGSGALTEVAPEASGRLADDLDRADDGLQDVQKVVPGRFSNRDRLGKHTLADPRLQARFGDHIDRMTKEILEIHEQCGQVQQTSPWFEIDQEVDVAGRVGLPARDRPEDADIARAMAGSDGQDLPAYAGEIVDRRPIGHTAPPCRSQ